MGSRRARIVLPAPGGPIINMLWPQSSWTDSGGGHEDVRDVHDLQEAGLPRIGVIGPFLAFRDRPLQAHCHLGLGRLYRLTANQGEAHEHLMTATAMYHEMDMGFWLEKAEAELGPPVETHPQPG